jgi:DNA ligase-1
LRFHVKKLNIRNCHKKKSSEREVFKKLSSLANSTGASDIDKAELYCLAHNLGKEAVEVVTRIVNKDLKAGFSGKLINKAVPGTINLVPYCRCSTHKKLSNIAYPAYAQEKADGTFANCMINKKGKIKFITRNGSKIHQLDKLSKTILYGNEKLNSDPKIKKTNKRFGIANSSFKEDLMGRVYTGELLVTRDGKILPRKEGNGIINQHIKGTANLSDNEKIIFLIWDSITLEEFYNGKSDTYYETRLFICRQFVNYIADPDTVNTIDYEVVSSEEEAFIFYKKMRKEGKEGAIVKNMNAPWKDGTSTVMCKLKNEMEVDLRIVNWVHGKEGTKYENCLGAIKCESSCGKLKVNVGSGFSDEERNMDWDKHIGKVVTIACESVIQSKSKKESSLFLPRFVEIREDRDDAESLIDILER